MRVIYRIFTTASYFLFATLESVPPPDDAGPTRQTHESHPQRLTVLTGTPVAGIIHLDRPSPAGYFVFPDLSVRHEGYYRLKFSLFEGLKDMNSDTGPETQGETAHVTNRLEVHSTVFLVFSAKRFPGLTESTALSRLIAEQGCRVRIRRDARVR
ncbi:hypothetical protein K470DRAFT_224031, partial [Piedraia hortae CBS 480.64]